jgi:hypothetical protein
MDFSNLFSKGKSGGLGPRRVDRVARLESIVDRQGADRRAQWRHASVGCAVAGPSRCSIVAVEEDEPNEAMPEGCSLEHERWRRGSVTEVKLGLGEVGLPCS